MSRDEETDDLSEAGRRAGPGEAVDMSKPFVAAPVPASRFAVFIDADGSATINGVAVQAASGQSLDEAVLDTLHRHAHECDFPVTAAISDPDSAHVTFVEVAPDGSSRLVEQPVAPTPSLPPPPPPAETTETAETTGNDPGDLYDNPGDTLDNDPDENPDDGPDTPAASRFPLARPSLPRPSLPSFSPRLPSLPLLRRSKDSTAGAGARQSDDEYRGPGLLHRPLVVGSVAVGVVALVIVPLVILGARSDGGETNNSATGASDKLNSSPTPDLPRTTPTVSLSPSLRSPSPTTSPSAKPKRKDTGRADGAKGVTTTVTMRPPKATVTVTSNPAPGPTTAATAVNRLAKKDPGRHICYRAYVSRRGWGKPVCDGGTSGTPGRGTITAVNIAVSGTKGTSGGAYVHDPASSNGEGHFAKAWTAVPDGLDHYLGSTKKNAPHMLGFTISVDGGAGEVCQATYVHGDDWLGRRCDVPGHDRDGFDFTYAGTHDNDLWIEAIRLTV